MLAKQRLGSKVIKVETVQLDIKLRDKSGSTASRQYRRNGMLPGVIYSGGKEAKSILVSYKDFFQAAKKSKTSQVFRFKSEDSELDGTSAVVRDLQREYTKEALLHVDFQLLEEGSAVKVRIPLEITGVARGVKDEGGVLQIAAREVIVHCLSKNIPSILEVDITTLSIGQRIKTGDIELPEGVVLTGNPEETVVNIVATRTSGSMMDEASTEAVPVEGEGAEGAEGGEASADGEKKEDAAKEGSE